ncbi:MAG: diacylglycerol kinase [Opitutaceae bacterium]|nr:diacylglycerol kinase [Opitutaceae bacterium]
MRTLVATQANARIHAAATVAVVAAGLWLRVGADDWCWLAAATAAVWTAEAFNTALEFLADEVSLEHRERIGRAKDLAAAAVLCAAVGAAVIGALVFAPHLAT